MGASALAVPGEAAWRQSQLSPGACSSSAPVTNLSASDFLTPDGHKSAPYGITSQARYQGLITGALPSESWHAWEHSWVLASLHQHVALMVQSDPAGGGVNGLVDTAT